MFDQLIQSGNINLATHLLNHEANVLLTNDAGMDCIANAEAASQQQRQQDQYNSQQNRENKPRPRNNTATALEWTDFIEELKRRESLEKARMEARDRARSQANDE